MPPGSNTVRSIEVERFDAMIDDTKPTVNEFLLMNRDLLRVRAGSS
jgi:hypothetical protein